MVSLVIEDRSRPSGCQCSSPGRHNFLTPSARCRKSASRRCHRLVKGPDTDMKGSDTGFRNQRRSADALGQSWSGHNDNLAQRGTSIGAGRNLLEFFGLKPLPYLQQEIISPVHGAEKVNDFCAGTDTVYPLVGRSNAAMTSVSTTITAGLLPGPPRSGQWPGAGSEDLRETAESAPAGPPRSSAAG